MSLEKSLRVISGLCITFNILFLVLVSVPGFAQEKPTDLDEPISPILKLGSEYQNSIELLRNRFRIDHNVKEITMVFFREYGSSPIVLVQPDGSKLFQSTADGDKIAWFDSETYDMIYIKNPVAGPWQAVGQILPDSRIMVLSDVELHAQSLPPILFAGEILKQTATLTNGTETIDYGPFKDVVELSVELISTNNPDFDNFGAQSEVIAHFEDNGAGMDERPLDGLFAGEFNLAVPPGEWQPVFKVTTPMFTREQVDPTFQLYPTPILISEELNGGGENYHKITIDAVRDLVDINSLLVDGKVRFPNGDIQNFSITDPSEHAREHLIVAYEDGVFRVKITAFGKTVNGRDFIIDVPEYNFFAKAPEPEVPEETENIDADGNQINENSIDLLDNVDNQTNSEQQEPEPSFPLALILWINGIILIVGALIITVVLIIRNGLPSWLSFGKKKPEETLKDSTKIE